MQAQWQAFLTARGAEIEACAVQRSEPTAPERGTDEAPALIDLSHWSLLSARGTDATEFLQGQLSGDVTALARGGTHLTSYSTPQGRMLAIMRAFQHGDSLQLMLPRELAEPIRLRLSRYMLRARVELGSDDASLGRIALAGGKAGALLKQIGLPVPSRARSETVDDALSVVNATVEQPCYIVAAPYETLMHVWQEVETDTLAGGDHCWRRLQIDEGIPTVYEQTSETFVPQMVNLELLGGVDFDKGCYTGQEIVARTQYLGRIKRRMFRFACSGEHAPAAGDPIVLDDGTEVGTVVDSAAAGSRRHLLAVVRLDAVAQPMHHATPGGATLQRLDLPYAVPSS